MFDVDVKFALACHHIGADRASSALTGPCPVCRCGQGLGRGTSWEDAIAQERLVSAQEVRYL
jgi:hypothetical protein